MNEDNTFNEKMGREIGTLGDLSTMVVVQDGEATVLKISLRHMLFHQKIIGGGAESIFQRTRVFCTSWN